MAWARLDDRWHDHPKVIAAGLDGAGLFAMCLTWAHSVRRTSPTPGVVPDAVVVRFAGPKAAKLTALLRQVRLFDARTDAGWPIHDFDDYLPAYDAEQARAAGSRGGKAKASRKRTATEPLSEPLDELEANRVADDEQTSSTRASARRDPVPVPKSKSKTPSSAAADAAFEEFWDLCPRKVGKDAARKAWVSATKRAAVDDVLAGVRRYQPLWRGMEQKYIPHPSTWLNDGRWQDDLSTPNAESPEERMLRESREKRAAS